MTWNVVHNFPGAKDTYQVPVDYPTVGYDTIIAAWFTDVFTSILAIQEAIIGATSIVLLKAGGTMTGDLELQDEVKLYLDTAKTTGLRYNPLTESVEILSTNPYITAVAELQIQANTGPDGEGEWKPTLNFGTNHILEIRGVVEFRDDARFDPGDGPVLKSPNLTSYRIKVANDGTLSTEVV